MESFRQNLENRQRVNWAVEAAERRGEGKGESQAVAGSENKSAQEMLIFLLSSWSIFIRKIAFYCQSRIKSFFGAFPIKEG